MGVKNGSDEQFRTGPRKHRGAYKGFYLPRNISKYKGDPTNVVYRSLMELRAMKYFDEHTDVLEWSSEEIFIPYESPLPDKTKNTPKIRRYFVDFKVKCRLPNGKIITYLIEVKPFSQVTPPKKPKTSTTKRLNRYRKEVEVYMVNEAKWKAAKKVCDNQGWEFKIITEKQLRF